MKRNYFHARETSLGQAPRGTLFPKLLKRRGSRTRSQETYAIPRRDRDDEGRESDSGTADAAIEVGEALLEHFGVARIAGRLDLLQDAGAGEAKAFTLLTEL